MKNVLCRGAVLLSLLSLPVAVAFAKGDIPDSQRALILRQAYTNLAQFVAAGGDSLELAVSNQRTIEARELGKTFWLDLITMPGGDMIDMTRESTQINGKDRVVVYRPKWRLAGEEYLATEEGMRLNGMTVDQVLAEVAAQMPSARDVVAITTYDVTVSYQGRQRSYKAAALWLAAHGRRDATVVFLDHITQGLEDAVREPANPIRRPSRPVGPDAGGGLKALCTVATNHQRVFQEISGTDGHVTGSHTASADVDFACSCALNCSATCQPSFVSRTCSDSGGNYDACHKMATSVNIATSSVGNGLTTGPACSAGQGCVKKSCLFCSCGLSVSVSVSGTSVSFSSSGLPDWDGNLSFSQQCGTCAEKPTSGTGSAGGPGANGPYYQEPPPPVDSGGSGFGCHVWHTHCVYEQVPGGEKATCYPDYCLW